MIATTQSIPLLLGVVGYIIGVVGAIGFLVGRRGSFTNASDMEVVAVTLWPVTLLILLPMVVVFSLGKRVGEWVDR